MKYIMISTFLLIIAMTFSCAEKSVTTDINAETTVRVATDDSNLEQKTPIVSSVDESEDLKTSETKQVSDQVSKKTVKESNAKVDVAITEEIKEDTREWPIEKQIDKVVEAEEVVKITEQVAIVKKEPTVEAVSKQTEVKEIAVMAKPDHSVFNSLLSTHVTSKGVVDYAGLKKNSGKLDAYLSDLDKNSVSSDWSKNEKLAYWINAYNAFTIKLILDNYPLKSIQDINGGKPWDKKWINLDGKTYSLNQIENDIIRPDFKEPRIHFAVNCAAQSCPPLANKAFTADNLNSLLEKQTKSFINNSKYNTITEKSVTISKIFDWYGVDFGDKIAFLNKYTDRKIGSDAKISYTEYDWGLNNK